MKVSGFRFTAFLVLAWIVQHATGYASDQSLEQRLATLEQETAVLKRQLELEKEDRQKKAQESAFVTASAKDGFVLKSPDDSFRLRLRGLVQFDGRFYPNDNTGAAGATDEFLVRRVRPILEGTVGKNFDFLLVPDFGSGATQLLDAYVEYKEYKPAKLRVGKFKVPFGLESLQSDPVRNFVENGLPTNLTPNRDVGLQVSGELLTERLNYALGIFDGAGDGGASLDRDNNNDKDVAARVFTEPFKGTDSVLSGLGFGLAATSGYKEVAASLPTYRSPGQATIFNYTAANVAARGSHLRLAPQFYYYRNAFGLFGEYITSDQDVVRPVGAARLKDSFKNESWQLSGTYVLTGEFASYRGVAPRNPFSLKDGGWGAWELAARYGTLDIDNDIFRRGFGNFNTHVTAAKSWAVGLNWHLTRNLRTTLNYERTAFDHGAAGGRDRKAENIIFSRVQVYF